ncbi:MAG: IS630 family transposase [Chloroflexi bacterium]|nr:IS630 family transposase [Chloroflexota bacterium]
MLTIVRREPRILGYDRSRWSLEGLQQVVEWLSGLSVSGVWRLLRRLGIHYKQARSYIHSPDPDYEAKLARIQDYIRLAKAKPEKYVVLFQDELTYYRQPSEAKAYEAVGKAQPQARRSPHKNSQRRIAAAMEIFTGKVVYMQKSRIGVDELVAFYEKVVEAFPDRTIYMVQDNWPVHFHADVLAALEPQTFEWPLRVPWNWPKEPSSRARHLNLPIRLVMLPTYASWANPIEKLWRWLKQDVLHLHAYAEKWTKLWQRVDEFLDKYAEGSADLLRYVGLTTNSALYGPALSHVGPPPLLPD